MKETVSKKKTAKKKAAPRKKVAAKKSATPKSAAPTKSVAVSKHKLLREPIYIVDGVRTPFCKMGTLLGETGAVDLGRVAVSSLLAKTGILPDSIDEVIIGCVGQPADAANLARVIALRSGIPESVPAMTVHRNCASGFEAVTQAAEKILIGRGDAFIVGGAESMSQIPFLYNRGAVKKFSSLARSKSLGQRLSNISKFRFGDFSPIIGLRLGLSDPVCGLNMGETAELLAREFGISREEQDEFSLVSHLRAFAAQERLKQEITPVYLTKGKKGGSVVEADNGPRKQQTIEALAKLKPVFDRREGTVTAGNASQVTDGAVALLMMSEKGLKESGLTPIGKLVAYEYAGCNPSRMGLGPVHAIAKAEEKTGLGLSDAELIEINEAFAAQVLAVERAAKNDDYCKRNLGRDKSLGEIPREILNVNGGAIAHGHPVGATGARLVLATLKELGRRKGKRALVSLCVGGGQGGALWLETV